ARWRSSTCWRRRASCAAASGCLALPEMEQVSLIISEDGRPAPLLLLGRHGEVDSGGAEPFVGGLDVVVLEEHVAGLVLGGLRPAGARLVEDQAGAAAGRLDLDPPVLAVGHVLRDGEAHLAAPEVERPLLVSHVQTDLADGDRHDPSSWCRTVMYHCPPTESGGRSAEGRKISGTGPVPDISHEIRGGSTPPSARCGGSRRSPRTPSARRSAAGRAG